MREIVFRGKNIDNGQWVEGQYVERMIKADDGIPGCIPSWNIVRPDGSVYTEIDPRTLGQYTGVDDAKGKRIFEGDILELRRGKAYNFELQAVGEVKYSAYHTGFYVDEFGAYSIGEAADDFVVVCIGNVCDHPWKLKSNPPRP